MNTQKFFKKECTPEEARQVLEWFSRQEVESWQEDDLHALPDGSKVMLNARSAITYAADFNEYKREVKLAGEAFFQVAKDSLRPFTIHSRDISTTALGTSFNINYWPDRAVAEVSLATGVVQVATKDKTSDLKATKTATRRAVKL